MFKNSLFLMSYIIKFDPQVFNISNKIIKSKSNGRGIKS